VSPRGGARSGGFSAFEDKKRDGESDRVGRPGAREHRESKKKVRKRRYD